MRATFFSVATMAASAFAAPQGIPGGDVLGTVIPGASAPPAPPAAPEAPAAGGLGDVFEGIVGKKTGDKAARQAPELPTDLGGIDGLIERLTGLTEQLQSGFGNIEGLTGQVDSGEISADEAEPQVLDSLSSIELNLKDIVTQLTGQAGIPVADGDVERVLTVVQTLLDVLLANVNTLVTVLGLRPQLVSILHSVFTLLANLLTLVTGLVSGLVPGLIAALSPLLVGLSPLLQGLVTPVAALLASLSGV